MIAAAKSFTRPEYIIVDNETSSLLRTEKTMAASKSTKSQNVVGVSTGIADGEGSVGTTETSTTVLLPTQLQSAVANAEDKDSLIKSLRHQLSEAIDLAKLHATTAQTLQMELTQIRQATQELNRENDELVNDMHDAIQENDDLKQRLEDLTHQCGKYKDQCHSLRADKERLEDKLEIHREDTLDPAEVAELMEEIREQMKRKLKQVNRERHELEKQCRRLASEKMDLQEDLEKMSIEKSHSDKRVVEMADEISELQLLLTNVRMEKEELEKNIKDGHYGHDGPNTNGRDGEEYGSSSVRRGSLGSVGEDLGLERTSRPVVRRTSLARELSTRSFVSDSTLDSEDCLAIVEASAAIASSTCVSSGEQDLLRPSPSPYGRSRRSSVGARRFSAGVRPVPRRSSALTLREYTGEHIAENRPANTSGPSRQYLSSSSDFQSNAAKQPPEQSTRPVRCRRASYAAPQTSRGIFGGMLGQGASEFDSENGAESLGQNAASLPRPGFTRFVSFRNILSDSGDGHEVGRTRGNSSSVSSNQEGVDESIDVFSGAGRGDATKQYLHGQSNENKQLLVGFGADDDDVSDMETES